MQKKRVGKKKGGLTKRQLEEALVENFVKLQKVSANMSVKFDHLSDQISKLLQLFEIAAKSFVKKQEEGGSGDKDLLQKIDALLEQNKVIARGLTLMEEKLRHRLGETDFEEIHAPAQARREPQRASPPRHYTEAELHGLYPGNAGGRPRPGSLPGY